MTQVSKYKIDKDVYTEIFETFIQTIVNIKSKGQALNFFDNFLTPTEKIMFSKRLAIGILLSQGLTYREIVPILKISTTTIGTFLEHYKYNDGYKLMIDNIVADKKVKDLLLNITEKFSRIGSIGGKGSRTWREINKMSKENKSKLLR